MYMLYTIGVIRDRVCFSIFLRSNFSALFFREEKKLRVREDALLKIIEEARIQKRDFNDFFKTRIVLYKEMLDETRISLVDLKT